MKPFATLLSTLLLIASPLAVAQAPKPYEIADFVRQDKFKEVAVSQKGTYVAVAVPEGDRTVLYILKTGESRPLTRIDVSARRSHVYGIYWVSDHRLIYSVAVRDQLDERPARTGETWAIEADGSKRIRMPGYGVRVLDTLDDDDDHIVASLYGNGDGFTEMTLLDVYGGAPKRLAEAPIRYGWLMADGAQEARFAGGRDEKDFARLYWRAPGKDKWQVINDESVTGRVMYPAGFSADNTVAYLRAEEKTGPDAILAFDVATGTSKEIVRDAFADPSRLINAIGKRTPIGVLYAGATPRYVYFDPESEDAKAHQRLQKAFPGQIVSTSDYTTTRREVLVYTYADREPGGYYVMNLDTRKVSPMMFAADWLDPQRLAPMRDVVFQARDGRRIPALLTVPVGSDGKHLPLVIHPHGGPFGVQDDWGYDPTVQVLASHGYAVLQVNYRGSSGYGREFQEAGYKRWGLEMQDDLTDATRWAIDQGIADRDRICIFGASYGGYAALMGVAKEPTLYRCAVGQVGVYDLGRVRTQDSLGNDAARRFFERTMNDGNLSEVSPNRFAERIKVPVFLSAGHEDYTAPVEHTQMMEAALKKAGVPVETLYFKTEGHGIYKREHRAEFYARLLAFLQRNIGGRAPVPVADASAD